MRLSPNFFRAEFRCQCGCGYDTVDAELLQILEDVREHFDARVQVNSAARCRKHNSSPAVGSTDTSQHVIGRAADIEVENVSPLQVCLYLDHKYPDQYGLGNYKTFTHIDSRSKKARW